MDETLHNNDPAKQAARAKDAADDQRLRDDYLGQEPYDYYRSKGLSEKESSREATKTEEAFQSGQLLFSPGDP